MVKAGRELSPCNHVDVNAEVAGPANYPPHNRAAAGQFLPPAPLARAQDYLRYLVFPGEIRNGLSRVRVCHVVPVGPEVPHQGTQRLETSLVFDGFGIAGDDVNDAELALCPCRQPRRTA